MCKAIRTAVVAVVGMLTLVSILSANPTWEKGYPKRGTNGTTVTVKGMFAIPEGLTISGPVQVKVFPPQGGTVTMADFTLKAGQTGKIKWGPWTLTGVSDSESYVVQVIIDVHDKNGKPRQFGPGFVTLPAVNGGKKEK